MADMTPAAWLELLDQRLTARWSRWLILDEFFEGKHPLAFATTKFREAFGGLLLELADNWCRLIVTSSVERLKVQGFRFGSEQGADDDAWAIWQENGLDSKSELVHTEAVKLGESYWLIDPTPTRDGAAPKITYEHPSQVIVACAPGDPDTRLAALKRWVDDDQYIYWNVYLPGAVHKFRSVEKVRNGIIPERSPQYARRQDDPGATHDLQTVPVVPLRNSPSMLRGGQSDLEPVIPLQNAINKLAGDLIVASEYAAYRQRVMTGVEQPKDPITGKPIAIELGVNRLFTVEAPDAKIYDLQASDLKNYETAIEMFVHHLAAQTKTPPHYLLAKMVNASGDALSVAESGLVSKVRDKMVPFGEAHEETMRIAFKAMGDDRGSKVKDAETLWADPERRSFAQLADAAGKLSAIPGMPLEAIMEELGWSPQRIARVKTMQHADQLLMDALAPPPPGAPGAPTPPGTGQPQPAVPVQRAA